MNKFFVLLSVLMVSTFTFANDYPTIEINGIEHYLVNEDESTGEEWWSEDGYCVKEGFTWAQTSTSRVINIGPLVAMDDQGNVEKTFASNNGSLWVVTSVVCE